MKAPTKKEIRQWRKEGKGIIIVMPGDKVVQDPEYFGVVNPLIDIVEEKLTILGTVFRPWEDKK